MRRMRQRSILGESPSRLDITAIKGERGAQTLTIPLGTSRVSDNKLDRTKHSQPMFGEWAFPLLILQTSKRVNPIIRCSLIINFKLHLIGNWQLISIWIVMSGRPNFKYCEVHVMLCGHLCSQRISIYTCLSLPTEMQHHHARSGDAHMLREPADATPFQHHVVGHFTTGPRVQEFRVAVLTAASAPPLSRDLEWHTWEVFQFL